MIKQMNLHSVDSVETGYPELQNAKNKSSSSTFLPAKEHAVLLSVAKEWLRWNNARNHQNTCSGYMKQFQVIYFSLNSSLPSSDIDNAHMER